MHERKCYDCGNVAIHIENVPPGVCCQLCKSQDTRLVKPKRESGYKITPYPIRIELEVTNGRNIVTMDLTQKGLAILITELQSALSLSYKY